MSSSSSNEYYYVKNDLRNKNAAQVLSKANVVLSRMAGNVHFPSPNPSLNQIEIYADELKNILSNEEGKIQLVQRNKAQKQLADALRSLASYITYVGGSSAEIILSSGFDVRKKRSKVHLRPAPSIKRYIKLPQRGCIKLMWYADTSSVTYNVYATEYEKPETKTVVAMSTKSSVMVSGLESGKKYQLQVSAINSAGISGLSQCATVFEAWL